MAAQGRCVAPGEERLRALDRADVDDAADACHDAHHHVDEDFCRMTEVPLHELQVRPGASESAGGDRRRHRGEDDGRERADAEVAEDDLQREHGARDRRVKRGRDAGAAAAREEQRDLIPRERKHPTQ